MQISIIGTGNVGSALGSRWSGMGHKIIFGSRTPKSDKSMQLLQKCNDVEIVDQTTAASKSEIIVLATPWAVTLETLQSFDSLQGKLLIDCTNPLNPDLSLVSINGYKSSAEAIANTAKGAHIVKAFNITGAGNMLDPMFGIEQATMFICGDDEKSKKTAKLLAIELGFEVVDAGALSAAASLEHLAELWINLAYKQGFGTDVAFKLLKR